MAWLHAADPPIIHRDLKSDNILLDENRRAKVTDFGCAIAKEETVTKMGEIVGVNTAGSVPWMPPEAFLSGIQEAPGDVYAFSLVMWEIATSQTPWARVNGPYSWLSEGWSKTKPQRN